MEIWKDIEGCVGYQVSNFGRVKSLKRGGERIMSLTPNHSGYLQVGLSCNNKVKKCRVHRLVAQAFIPNSLNKPQINHIDGDKLNNRADNLEWATASENIRHALATGLKKIPQCEDRPEAKLTNEQVLYIRENPDGLTGRQLAKKLEVTDSVVRYAQLGKTYKNVGGTIRDKIKQRVPKNVREQIRQEFVPYSREFGACALARKYGCDPTTILYIVKHGR